MLELSSEKKQFARSLGVHSAQVMARGSSPNLASRRCRSRVQEWTGRPR